MRAGDQQYLWSFWKLWAGQRTAANILSGGFLLRSESNRKKPRHRNFDVVFSLTWIEKFTTAARVPSELLDPATKMTSLSVFFFLWFFSLSQICGFFPTTADDASDGGTSRTCFYTWINLRFLMSHMHFLTRRLGARKRSSWLSLSLRMERCVCVNVCVTPLYIII